VRGGPGWLGPCARKRSGPGEGASRHKETHGDGDKQDYYELLGVPRKATAKEIRTRFAAGAEVSPGFESGDKASEEKFKQLQEAYDRAV